MPVAQMPSQRRSGGVEKAAKRFIGGASPADSGRKAGGKRSEPRQIVMVRVSRELLARIDQAAERRSISRSAWMAFMASKVLDEGGA